MTRKGSTSEKQKQKTIDKQTNKNTLSGNKLNDIPLRSETDKDVCSHYPIQYYNRVYSQSNSEKNLSRKA